MKRRRRSKRMAERLHARQRARDRYGIELGAKRGELISFLPLDANVQSEGG